MKALCIRRIVLASIAPVLPRCAVAGMLALCALTNHAATAEPPDAHGILVMLRMPADHHRPDAAYGGGYGDPLTGAARRRMARGIARRYGLELVGDGWEMPLLGLDCYLMRVRPDEMVEAAMKRIADDPQIVWSEPMGVYQAEAAGATYPLAVRGNP